MPTREGCNYECMLTLVYTTFKSKKDSPLNTKLVNVSLKENVISEMSMNLRSMHQIKPI